MNKQSSLNAMFSFAILTSAAFVVAALTRDFGWLSFVPPTTDAVPSPAPDTDTSNALALYQSAFTAWTALLLLIPAYWYYLTRGAGDDWLGYWTGSYVAYLVHLYVSAFLFFGSDFAWMVNSSRVSAFWPGMALVLWWGFDLCLAYRNLNRVWVRMQRAILHLATFALFFGGSAIKGETMTIKLIGAVFAGVALAGLLSALRRRTT